MYQLPAATFHTPVAQCCGPLSAVNENKALYDFPELQKRVNYLGETEYQTQYHRCALCGQVWEEHWVPFMHADVSFLLKSEVNEDGTLVLINVALFVPPEQRINKIGLVENLELRKRSGA